MTVPGITVVNFAHPLSVAQVEQIASLAASPVDDVIAVDSQLDLARLVEPQVTAMVDRVGLTSEQWQTLPLVVVLPGLSLSAAVVLAEVHGRAGFFPTVAVVRRSEGSVPVFEVVELVGLQRVREAARRRR